MQSAYKMLVKEWLPPAIFRYLRRRFGVPPREYYIGPYASWEEAKRDSTGYAADIILDKVKAAASEVKAGRAVFERDSLLYHEPYYNFPLLAAIYRTAIRSDGQLAVLDFGGSLGSTYFQCRSFLSPIRSLRWCIVEQPHYVECGKQHFETDELRFYNDIDECMANIKPDIVLLSAVVQYLEDPYPLLRSICNTQAKMIILDRVPLTEMSEDIVAIEKVPPNFWGGANYPARIFAQRNLVEQFDYMYRLLYEFDAIDGIWAGKNLRSQYKGMVFELATL